MQHETSSITSTSENINVITSHLPSTSHVAQQSSTASCSRRNVSSFSSFRARKEAERSSFFKSTAKKAKTEEKQTAPVKINIGIMVMKDGKLSIKRGATLPLSVLPDIDSQQLLTKAVEKLKHARFNNNLINSATIYRLLYPGCKQVLNLPGSSEPFSLKKYKQDSRITFYLCSSEHFIESLLEDDSDDDEIIRGTSMIVNDSLTQTEDLALVTPGLQTADENRLDVQSTSSEIFTGNSVISTPTTSRRLSMVQCPICFNQYSFEDIERHADSCSM